LFADLAELISFLELLPAAVEEGKVLRMPGEATFFGDLSGRKARTFAMEDSSWMTSPVVHAGTCRNR
jgi:hypothetical protein